MRTTLRALENLEHLLLGKGRRTARRNAWTAVLEDRRRARARLETEQVLATLPAPALPAQTLPARTISAPAKKA